LFDLIRVHLRQFAVRFLNLWLAFGGRTRYPVSAMVSPDTAEERIPAPPELVAKAEALVREYGVHCFWFWHPEAKVHFMGDVRLVVEHLRMYGNWRAWRAAQELQRCL
jgi:hypothetical protein